jgi:hypothetical protein
MCKAWLERGWLQSNSDGLCLLPAAVDALTRTGWQSHVTERLLHLRGRSCLDWTERRLHVGGPLGVALTDAMLDADWLRHVSHSRALLPSADGLRRLAELGVRLE